MKMNGAEKLASRLKWLFLRHAYGSGKDVPQIVQALASRDENLRDNALHEGLWSALYHQGTLYSSTVFAIPLLIALLEEPDLPSRRDILEFMIKCLEMGQRAVAGVYRFAPVLPGFGRYFPSIEQQIARGREVYAKLAQGHDLEVSVLAKILEERSLAVGRA